MPKRIEPSIPPGGQLVRRADSDYWSVQWRDPEIKRPRRWSTGTRERAAAEIARERVAAGPREADPSQVASPAFVSVAVVLDDYYERHAQHIASAEQARIAVRHLKAHFRDARVADLEDEEAQQAHATARHEAKGVCEAAIDREISVLRAAVRLYAPRNPGAPEPRIYGVHLPDRHARWLRPAEADRLAAAATSPHVYLHILLALATAGRHEAVFDLTWDRIAAYLGHSHPAITARVYARFGPEHLADAAAAVDFSKPRLVR